MPGWRGGIPLKPCPFDGHVAAFGLTRYAAAMVAEQGWSQDCFHFISCCACGASNLGLVGFHTQQEAAAHWNSRHQPAVEPVDLSGPPAMANGVRRDPIESTGNQ